MLSWHSLVRNELLGGRLAQQSCDQEDDETASHLWHLAAETCGAVQGAFVAVVFEVAVVVYLVAVDADQTAVVALRVVALRDGAKVLIQMLVLVVAAARTGAVVASCSSARSQLGCFVSAAWHARFGTHLGALGWQSGHRIQDGVWHWTAADVQHFQLGHPPPTKKVVDMQKLDR